MSSFLLITVLHLFPSLIFSDVPRLPVYVGAGYDLIKANPKTDKLDPGFRSNIFGMSYNKGLSTEDGKYLIPDNTVSRNRFSCSFSSTTSQYTGTREYQKSLQTLVSGSTGFSIFIKLASFSSSFEFKSVEESTNIDHMIITESAAKCEVYSLEMGLYDFQNLSSNFKNAIFNVLSGDIQWEQIINNFGTHYIVSTILGGRMHIQNRIKSTSYQELTAMGIDLKLASKLSFSKLWTSDSSSEWKSYEKQVEKFETKIAESKEIYLGGRPPKSGDWRDWQELVLIQPVPIEYKINPISDLFTKVYFEDLSKQDLAKMRNEFGIAVENYCNISNCMIPDADNKLPPQATVLTYTSEAYGGKGGIEFNDVVPTNPVMSVRKVLIRSGRYIDQIQLYVSDSINGYYTSTHGGNGGSQHEWIVPEDEYISQIEVRHAKYLDSIRFITNRGTKSPKYGWNGGRYSIVHLKGQLVGFYGRAYKYVDKIGFISNEINYNL